MPFSLRSSSRTHSLVLALLIVLCIVLRQPDQWHHPVVWIEDGVQVLPDLLARGLRGLADPVNGYLIVCTKLVSWLALQFGLPYYPVASAILTLLVSTGIFVGVTLAPTRLRHAALCALIVVLAPVGPETFTSPIYLLWHSGILLLLVLVWTPDRAPGWRAALLIFGGLSSPMIAFVLPMLGLLWLVRRSRSDLTCMLLCTLVAGWQVYQAHRIGETGGATLENLRYLPALFAMLCGQFLSFKLSTHWAEMLGGLLLLWLVVPVFSKRIERDDRLAYLSLLGILALSVLAVLLRVGYSLLLQFHGPNRYYFMMFTVLGWLVVQRASLRSSWWVATPVLIAALVNSLGCYQMHDPAQRALPLEWSGPARTALATGQGALPVFMLGRVVSLNMPLDITLFQRQRRCTVQPTPGQAPCVVHPWVFPVTDYPAIVPRQMGHIVSTHLQDKTMWTRLDLGHEIGHLYREFHVVGKLAPQDIEVIPTSGEGGPLFDLRASFSSADEAARFAASYCVVVSTAGSRDPALLASPNHACDAALMH